MGEYVKLYFGEKVKNVDNKRFFKRCEFLDAEATDSTANANIPKYYDVAVTVETRDGEQYRVTVGARKINNALDRFRSILTRELEGDDGLNGEYVGKERNPVIVRVLMKLVGAWVNTNKAEKL